MKHWASDYIGKPWVSMARGPDTFDCWGLIYDIYKTQYNIELALNVIDPKNVSAYGKAINEGKEHPEWKEYDAPQEGFVVPVSKQNLFHHVGIWLELDGGLILHCYEGGCVVAQSLHSMKTQFWKKFKYYKHTQFKL